MSDFFTRRKLITAGLSTVAGASGIGAAAYFASRYGLIPPDHAGILGIGETLTYSTQRLLTSRHSLAREFKRSDISKIAPVNGPHPTDENYRKLLANGFQGLASLGRRTSWAPCIAFFGRTEAPTVRKSHYFARLRGGLVLHCRVDGRAAGLRLRPRRNPP